MKRVLAMILGGGAGTRLYPLTKLRAKPAVPLAVAGVGHRRVSHSVGRSPLPDGLSPVCATHYMVESELKAAGLAYPCVLYDLRRYKPHSEFLVIYWKQERPKTQAGCQVIAMGVPLSKLFKLQQLGGKRG